MNINLPINFPGARRAAAGIFDALADTAADMVALYDAFPDLNDVQPAGVEKCLPLSADEWEAELRGVAEAWRAPYVAPLSLPALPLESVVMIRDALDCIQPDSREGRDLAESLASRFSFIVQTAEAHAVDVAPAPAALSCAPGYAIEPQRDLLKNEPGDETNFEKCAFAEAEIFALFRVDPVHDSELIGDYATADEARREAAGLHVIDRDLPDALSWIVAEYDFGAEMVGGGSWNLSKYAPNGWHIMITGDDGADLPSGESWMVGTYPAGWSGEDVVPVRSGGHLSLRQAVASAVAIVGEA